MYSCAPKCELSCKIPRDVDFRDETTVAIIN